MKRKALLISKEKPSSLYNDSQNLPVQSSLLKLHRSPSSLSESETLVRYANLTIDLSHKLKTQFTNPNLPYRKSRVSSLQGSNIFLPQFTNPHLLKNVIGYLYLFWFGAEEEHCID
ncbi:hypothetical protein RIF29_29087 [Crotalaria pallida]|uniref:Uncharacterized protein n=1 Tax=Crotalaria pallida TaxID=3830 RepID=A0AAN9HX55_CROPI